MTERTIQVGDQVLYYCYSRCGWFPETVVAVEQPVNYIHDKPLGVELSNRLRRPYCDRGIYPGVRLLSAGWTTTKRFNNLVFPGDPYGAHEREMKL